MTENSCSRRILLAVTGLTPQVVTEAVYALACRAQSPWLPHEVHLITTGAGAQIARHNLIGPDSWFHRLCSDYALPAIDFPESHIHVVRDADGQVLDDIRTEAHNTQAADFITETVRSLTRDDNSTLHVSIAGGRKTMGYYLGYALSLFGRPQDRLSHVLVSEPYETNRDFYYPTPYAHPIVGRQDGHEITVDARDARVALAEIPFVRLREGLPARLRQGRAAFSEVVSTANRSREAPRLVLDVARRSVLADDQPIDLSETGFLIMLWLAKRNRAGNASTDWTSNAMADEFKELARRVLGNSMRAAFERIEKSLDQNRSIAIKLGKYFEPHKTKIKAAFVEALGDQAARRYIIDGRRAGEIYLNLIPLMPEQIEIIGY